MAEILVKAQDSRASDSNPDKWYASAVVAVFEDGHEYGRLEGAPNYYMIKVPGMSAADCESALEDFAESNMNLPPKDGDRRHVQSMVAVTKGGPIPRLHLKKSAFKKLIKDGGTVTIQASILTSVLNTKREP